MVLGFLRRLRSGPKDDGARGAAAAAPARPGKPPAGAEAPRARRARPEDLTARLITTNRYPVYYLAITKCGCTYLKNLFYCLDHGRPHPAGSFIHAHDQDLVRATGTPVEAIAASGRAFVVLRDPVDRFLSFYLDKIHGAHPQNFAQLRASLAKSEGIDLAPDLDVEAHRANCHRLLGWLERNLAGATPEGPNPHWRPQHVRVRPMRRLGLRHLTLDGLDWQLQRLLGDLIPDLEARMAAVTERNRTRGAIRPTALIDAALRARVDALYAEDRRLYDRASRAQEAARLAHHGRQFRIGRARRPKGIRVLAAADGRLQGVAVPGAGAIETEALLTAVAGGIAPLEAERFRGDPAPCLILLRDPVERLLAVYARMLVAGQPDAQGWLIAKLARDHDFERLDLLAAPERHLANLHRFLDYAVTRFGRRKVMPDFLRPQAEIADLAERMGAVAITHDGWQGAVADWLRGAGIDPPPGLAALSGPALPGALAPLLADPGLETRVTALYADDRAWLARATPAA